MSSMSAAPRLLLLRPPRRLAAHRSFSGASSQPKQSRSKSSSTNTIMVFASEVPVVAALNPYRKVEDVFLDVWRRTNPRQLEALQTKLHVPPPPSPEERVQELAKALGVEAPLAALTQEAAVAETAPAVVAASAKIAAALPASAPAAVREEVVQLLTSEMHKSFGARQEAPALQHYEREQRVAVRERNLVFSKKQLTTLGGYDVFVGGKIDGKAGGKVLEVKNRIKRFMTPLPPYDVAQLQTYLFILGATDGELVEHLRGDEAASKLTKVAWDARMWETQLAPFVLRFSSALVHFMGDEGSQAHFLQGESGAKREIIRRHWLQELPHGSGESDFASLVDEESSDEAPSEDDDAPSWDELEREAQAADRLNATEKRGRGDDDDEDEDYRRSKKKKKSSSSGGGGGGGRGGGSSRR
ncbi:hypothetical protein PybrP1_010244 [[Pythium] brassicae (nom. inval.)]|nr:hypothetical protein PybrP1_010244 [[Pythium] brassicae (nom. inval.)]